MSMSNIILTVGKCSSWTSAFSIIMKNNYVFKKKLPRLLDVKFPMVVGGLHWLHFMITLMHFCCICDNIPSFNMPFRKVCCYKPIKIRITGYHPFNPEIKAYSVFLQKSMTGEIINYILPITSFRCKPNITLFK